MSGLNNEQIAIAINHINLAKDEITECANTLYATLEMLEKQCDNHEMKENIIKAIATLQIQDIVTQRLTKLEDFMQRIDTVISLPQDNAYLEEFAWENEVDQNDIDAMFNERKG
ncbi:hypothetical protein NitYY0826_C0707 [Nitratiruptor sp. YY08-26]|uniref:hypothetical protein n=1 Tax=unclassified Nitratiruptor TaxID=2624044 RepID=UPI001916B9AE|nr:MULTISPECIES: hypothetical protein [unclassified Nitratiruptor]BCD61844.1 hypothetical protein NitYY0813_C0705 [Nitratiruptor sp. YY08-13]BCD65779.1 hypothetical protein NitYY0826_C0707 [Nitratiruptor sp. YY08-26]